MGRIAQNLYLLNCLHFYWARLGKTALMCEVCGEVKPVIHIMGRK